MEELFVDMYKDSYARLFSLAYRITGCREDAEDALQTSWLNAYKSLHRFRGDSSLATWLYRIVVRECLRAGKKAEKLPVDSYADANDLSLHAAYAHINSFGKTEDTAIVNAVMKTCLQMFMNCLPKKQRAVFTLRVILKMSGKEAAEVLSISQSAIKVSLHRARKHIRAHMDGRCSLYRPGGYCNCRRFADYMIQTGQLAEVPELSWIQSREDAAVASFEGELSRVLDVDALYQYRLEPTKYQEFIERLKTIAGKNSIRILSF